MSHSTAGIWTSHWRSQHIEYPNLTLHRHGKRLDHDERQRKKMAREGHNASKKAQNYRGLRAKQYAETRRKEKIQMKQKIRARTFYLFKTRRLGRNPGLSIERRIEQS
jgi:hypothetical protein